MGAWKGNEDKGAVVKDSAHSSTFNDHIPKCWGTVCQWRTFLGNLDLQASIFSYIILFWYLLKKKKKKEHTIPPYKLPSVMIDILPLF